MRPWVLFRTRSSCAIIELASVLGTGRSAGGRGCCAGTPATDSTIARPQSEQTRREIRKREVVFISGSLPAGVFYRGRKGVAMLSGQARWAVLLAGLSLVPAAAQAQPSGGPYGPIPQTYDVPKAAGHVYYVAPD